MFSLSPKGFPHVDSLTPYLQEQAYHIGFSWAFQSVPPLAPSQKFNLTVIPTQSTDYWSQTTAELVGGKQLNLHP